MQPGYGQQQGFGMPGDAQPMLQGQLGQPPLRKFSQTWKVIFFVSACVVVGGAVVGFLNLLTSLQFVLFDLISLIYVAAIGLLLLILDVPYAHPNVELFKNGIYKYILFLTRFIGRGFTYLFLGSMLTAQLWNNNVSPFLGFIIGGGLGAVGCLSMYKGLKISRKLEKVRRALLNRGGPTPSICPPQGLRTDKFAELAMKIQGEFFDHEELMYIANALSLTIHGDDVISQKEFQLWLSEGSFVLI